MANVRVGKKDRSVVIRTQDIALIADTYLLMNQRKSTDPSFVFTGLSAKATLEGISKFDKSLAFVSNQKGETGGFYFNVEHIKDVQDHYVIMDFGTTNASPNVRTAFSKAEMSARLLQA